MAAYSFELFFEMSLDLMVVASDGYFRRVNPAFERALGFSESELTSAPVLSWIHPDDIDATRVAIERLHAGHDLVLFVNRYRHKQGGWRTLEWTSRALQPGQKHRYSVARDITARVQQEAERERVLEEIRESLAKPPVTGSLIPICSFCKSVRLPSGQWENAEHYFARRYDLGFSGAYCPTCVEERYPGLLSLGA